MDFRLLQIRLIAHIKARVRNGDGTERSLARLSGISQPHMHNVLKGARVFSPELADQVLRRLRIDLLDCALEDARKLFRIAPGLDLDDRLRITPLEEGQVDHRLGLFRYKLML